MNVLSNVFLLKISLCKLLTDIGMIQDLHYSNLSEELKGEKKRNICNHDSPELFNQQYFNINVESTNSVNMNQSGKTEQNQSTHYSDQTYTLNH